MTNTRDIAFKGRCSDTKMWFYGDLIRGYPSRTFIGFWANDKYHKVQVNPETVGQFIERNDKNDDELYEGDIIKIPEGYTGDHYYSQCIAYIAYDGGEYYAHNPKDSAGFIGQEFSWEDVEKIGNKHDNPELLE